MKLSFAPYHLLKHRLPALLMIVALLWLTVSTPFIYKQQQEVKKEAAQKQQRTDKTDDNNPLNNTEEKSESGPTVLSEYLHDVHLVEHHYTILTTYYKCHHSDTYLAFHPETISPPPDAVS